MIYTIRNFAAPAGVAKQAAPTDSGFTDQESSRTGFSGGGIGGTGKYPGGVEFQL